MGYGYLCVKYKQHHRYALRSVKSMITCLSLLLQTQNFCLALFSAQHMGSKTRQSPGHYTEPGALLACFPFILTPKAVFLVLIPSEHLCVSGYSSWNYRTTPHMTTLQNRLYLHINCQ